jgi:hypothetical protein
MERLNTLHIEQSDDPARLPLDAIAKLTQLQRLVIAGKDNVPPRHLSRIAAALPNCTIVDEWEEW